MWELIFLMFVLKIPIVYLACVVYWAIKAEPKPLEGAVLPAAPVPAPEPPPCPWLRRRVRPRLPHPSSPRGGRVRRVHAPVPR